MAKKKRTSKCSICGLRNRGDDHEKGNHHLRRAPHVTGAKVSRLTKEANRRGLKRNIGDLGDYIKEHNGRLPPGF